MTWFEFFFKHQPIVYERGTLAFQLLENRALFAFFVIAAGVGAYFLYRTVQSRSSWGMIVLRGLTFAVLLFILMRPVLNISTVLPQESYMAVIVDNSQSMQIQDEGQQSRADLLMAEFESSQFFSNLAEKFQVRLYRFDQEAERIEDLNRMTFNGTRTRMESAMELLYQELGTVPLSGIVLVTDGVDNASEEWTEAVSRIQARGIPIYTVGVGEEAIDRDAELTQVSTPRESLNDATAVAEVSFRSEGLAGRRATLHVRENGVLLKSEEVTLPRDGEIGKATIDLPVRNEGSRVFEFSLEAQDDRIAENNVLQSLIEVSNEQPKILYIEGEPRWEYRFIRRALEDDPNVQLVTLLRTSPNKFYRQGIEDEETLAEGFPTTREELFEYKGLILGSIEATFFTQDQLQMIVDFVSQRGGGFMMLGGRNSFSAGRYQNTPVADILPVRLSDAESDFVVDNLWVELSDYGRSHQLMKLNPGGDENVVEWDELPALTEFNRVDEAKVGAIVLANAQTESTGRDRPVLLAYQRYGRGRAMAFTSSSSWRWQMEMDHEDMTHELFWRQMLRWLVSSSPDPVEANAEKDSYVPGESIRLFADISDASFERMNNADVVGRVIDPDGNSQLLRFEWTGLQDGTYQAMMSGSVSGIYTLEVDADYGGTGIGNSESTFQVRDRPIEFYNAALDSRFLESVAEQSGGRYYRLSELGNLPEDAIYVEGESSIIEGRELWDVPLLFMLLTLALGAEWFWRKQKGLA